MENEAKKVYEALTSDAKNVKNTVKAEISKYGAFMYTPFGCDAHVLFTDDYNGQIIVTVGKAGEKDFAKNTAAVRMATVIAVSAEEELEEEARGIAEEAAAALRNGEEYEYVTLGGGMIILRKEPKTIRFISCPGGGESIEGVEITARRIGKCVAEIFRKGAAA